MRVIFCGGRNWHDHPSIRTELERLDPHTDRIITGGAQGADTIAADEAVAMGFEVEVFYADWTHLGKAAGVIRNQEMLESGVDLVVAFPGGKGTADMLRRAEKAGVPVRHGGT